MAVWKQLLCAKYTNGVETAEDPLIKLMLFQNYSSDSYLVEQQTGGQRTTLLVRYQCHISMKMLGIKISK